MKYLKVIAPILAVVAAFLGAYLGGRSTVDLIEYNEAKEALQNATDSLRYWREQKQIDTLYLGTIEKRYNIYNEKIIERTIIRDSIINNANDSLVWYSLWPGFIESIPERRARNLNVLK